MILYFILLFTVYVSIYLLYSCSSVSLIYLLIYFIYINILNYLPHSSPHSACLPTHLCPHSPGGGRRPASPAPPSSASPASPPPRTVQEKVKENAVKRHDPMTDLTLIYLLIYSFPHLLGWVATNLHILVANCRYKSMAYSYQVYCHSQVTLNL